MKKISGAQQAHRVTRAVPFDALFPRDHAPAFLDARRSVRPVAFLLETKSHAGRSAPKRSEAAHLGVSALPLARLAFTAAA